MTIRVINVKDPWTKGILSLSGARDSPLGNPIVLPSEAKRGATLEAFRSLLETFMDLPRYRRPFKGTQRVSSDPLWEGQPSHKGM